MDELIEQLREKNEPIPTPLELPDADMLVEIEEQLLLQLPGEYREFLLTVSDVVYGNLEPATVSDPQSHTYLPELAAVAWDRGVPRHLLPICEHGDNYYCIDPGGAVLYWSGGELTEDEWETIWYWVRDVWLDSAED
jgi:hypothetical protein